MKIGDSVIKNSEIVRYSERTISDKRKIVEIGLRHRTLVYDFNFPEHLDEYTRVMLELKALFN